MLLAPFQRMMLYNLSTPSDCFPHATNRTVNGAYGEVAVVLSKGDRPNQMMLLTEIECVFYLVQPWVSMSTHEPCD